MYIDTFLLTTQQFCLYFNTVSLMRRTYSFPECFGSTQILGFCLHVWLIQTIQCFVAPSFFGFFFTGLRAQCGSCQPLKPECYWSPQISEKQNKTKNIEVTAWNSPLYFAVHFWI